jgi:hypothetical protein
LIDLKTFQSKISKMLEQKQEPNSNPATPSDVMTNTPPSVNSTMDMPTNDSSLMPPPPLPTTAPVSSYSNFAQPPQPNVQTFPGVAGFSQPQTSIETQQQQLLRQTINRPIPPQQLRAMKTGEDGEICPQVG